MLVVMLRGGFEEECEMVSGFWRSLFMGMQGEWEFQNGLFSRLGVGTIALMPARDSVCERIGIA